MELLKDCDYIIDYHLGRVNTVVDALNKKATSSLAYVQTIYFPLLFALRNIGVRLNMNYSRALFANFHIHLVVIG